MAIDILYQMYKTSKIQNPKKSHVLTKSATYSNPIVSDCCTLYGCLICNALLNVIFARIMDYYEITLLQFFKIQVKKHQCLCTAIFNTEFLTYQKGIKTASKQLLGL